METVDARGLLCPLPVVRTQNFVKTVTHGTEIEILATDRGVLEDIPAWCRIHGHRVSATEEFEGIYKIQIVVGDAA